MGSDVTLTLRNFWEKIGKSKLTKINPRLKQFDGTVIKVMGTFEKTFESKRKKKKGASKWFLLRLYHAIKIKDCYKLMS